MLGEFPGYSWHVCWAPCENFPVLIEELDERTFLFGGEILRHESGLRGVRQVDLMRSGVAAGVELSFGRFFSCIREDIVVCCLSDVRELLLHAKEL